MSAPARAITAVQISRDHDLTCRISKYLTPVILAAVDYLMVIMALLTAWFLRSSVLLVCFPGLPTLHLNIAFVYFIIPAAFFLFLLYGGLYSKRLPFWKSAEILFRVCVYVNILVIVLTYILGPAEAISRLFILLSAVFTFTYLCVGRYITKRFLISLRLWQRPVIIIGAGKTAELLAKSFASDQGLGYAIAGLIEDCSSGERPLLYRYPYFGCFKEAEQAIVNSGVEDVIIATPGLERQKLLNLVYRIQPYIRNLSVVPDLFGMPLSNMEVETLFNEKAVLLKIRNNMALNRNRFLKRVFDLFGSICGVILISPLLVGIGMAIYICDPGPVLFAHKRVGANGRTFFCYKFRSMVKDAPKVLKKYLAGNPEARREWDREFKLKNDPRILSIGRILRKTSLDELPQLFNVIKGEMSLVGPRPIVEEEVVKYGEYIHDYYLVRPGMTGYWQVSGRNDVDYDQRVRMDAWYVRNWSFWQDIVLLFKTISVVLTRRGAY